MNLDQYRSLLPRDGDARYVAGFVPAVEADEMFAELEQTLAWSQPQIRLFGKRVPVPRLVAWYGDPAALYAYSSLTHEPLAWTPLLVRLRERIAAFVQSPCNGVLANLYRDGRDRIGWHADDERELGAEPMIASLSFGATRRFCLRHRAQPKPIVDILLEAGSLLVMRGATQTHWQHSVPRESCVHEPRINLTFRYVGERRSLTEGIKKPLCGSKSDETVRERSDQNASGGSRSE